MNKVITINLNGVAYQLEEGGYHALRDYLDLAASRLEGNPDKDEIMADIEQAIADKFRSVLGAYKTVVTNREVESVIAEMGPVQDADDATDTAASGPKVAREAGAKAAADDASATVDSPPPSGTRRLFKIREGAMISGVCNGLGAFFNIDVTIVRILFVLLVFTWGAGILLYLVMALIVPEARTPEEKAAASGTAAATAQAFIRRAKAGYYEGMKTLHDKQAHREWKRKFKQEMRTWKHNFRREMHHNTRDWQQNWQRYWAQHPGATGGMMLAASLISLVLFGLAIAMVYAIYTLVTGGQVFGLALPADLPLWIGIVGVVLVFHLLSWPLRAARHACWCQGRWGPGCHPRMAGPLDGVIGLAVFVVIIWLADHHVPEFHEWLRQLLPALRSVLDALQEWWNGRP